MRQKLALGVNRNLLWLLIAATLMVRALVPAGYMPASDSSDVLVAKLCNSAQPIVIKLGREQEPPRADQDKPPCAFAGFGGDAPIGGNFAELADRVPAEQQKVAVLAPLLLQRLARVLPPGRAPPLTA